MSTKLHSIESRINGAEEMKIMKTEDAVGQVLCHDITQIIKDVTKDALFRKGHVIREEDVPVLLSLGKEHIYIWEKDEGKLHENEAAEILKEISMGCNVDASEVKEGKIDLTAKCDGLLTIETESLRRINSLGNMMIATRHSGFPVKQGDKLAGTRIIPLVIEKEKMEQAKMLAGEKPLINVLPFRKKKYGIIVTGSEVYHGRVEDTFTKVIEEKMNEFHGVMGMHGVIDDNPEHITQLIEEMLEQGMDLVICTGGMSVDPDDKTPLAIRNAGAKMVTYGAPVLPGAMFALSYTKDGKPIMGLPGCVMYAKRTIFDLVLPRIMAGEEVTEEMVNVLGEGGLCLNCDLCTFPNCSFGK